MTCHVEPELSDAQWRRVELLFRDLRATSGPGARRGRPAHSPRAVLGAILWVMATGEVWAALPVRFPDYRSCHRRFRLWYGSGLLQAALERLYGAQGLAMCEGIGARMHKRVDDASARHNR